MTKPIANRTATLLVGTALLACIGCGESQNSSSSGFTCEVGAECDFPFFGTWSGTLSRDSPFYLESGGTFSITIASDGLVTGQGSAVVSVVEIDATADVIESTDEIEMPGHPCVRGERVQVTRDSGALVGGLSLLTDYFVELKEASSTSPPRGSVSLHLTEAAARASDPPIDLTRAVGEFTMVALEEFDLTSGTGKLTNMRNSSDDSPPPGVDDPDAELEAIADILLGAPAHNQHERNWSATVFTLRVDGQLEHGVSGLRFQTEEIGSFQGCPAVGRCYFEP